VSSKPDARSPEDEKPPAEASGPIELSGGAPLEVSSDQAVKVASPGTTSGSIDISVSSPKLPEAGASGSIDVVVSGPTLPVVAKPPEDGAPIVEASAIDSAPVSSGRVTSMTVAATGPTEATRSKRISGMSRTLDKGVVRIGSGLETIGEGVSKLGEASKKVPLVGSSVSALGEGITSVGESLTDLPRVARTRRGRLLVRSVIVGLLLVFAWIAIIVLLQVRGTDSPDFRPHAERILRELSSGSAAIEQIYEQASPRFHEMVRKDRFVDDMTDLHATVGKFREITSINESLVTRGPTGRIGRVSLGAEYEKGRTRASVSLHWYEGEWKLFGVGVEVPPELKITLAEREERVAACKDPMDSKRCDVHVAANRILEQLRDGHADVVWDNASDVFQKQEQKSRFIKLQAEHQNVLGEYRRIIAVTEAKVIGGTRGSYDVLVEYAKANVRAMFGFIRASKAEPWALRSLKVVLPMPRIDDLERAANVGQQPVTSPANGSGSGSANGSGSGSANGSGSGRPATGSGTRPVRPRPPPVKNAGSAAGSSSSGSAAPGVGSGSGSSAGP